MSSGDTVISTLAALLNRLGPFRSELGVSMQPASSGPETDPVTLVTLRFADQEVTTMVALSALASALASLGDRLVTQVAQAADDTKPATLDDLKQSFRSYLEQTGVLSQQADDDEAAGDDQVIAYCPHCGSDIAEFTEREASYCPYCGAEL